MLTGAPPTRFVSVTAVAIITCSGSNVSLLADGTTRGGVYGRRALDRGGDGVATTRVFGRTRMGERESARRFANGDGAERVSGARRTRVGVDGGVENGSMRRYVAFPFRTTVTPEFRRKFCIDD